MIKKALIYSLWIYLTTFNKKVIEMKRKIEDKVRNDQRALCPLCKSHKSLFCYKEVDLDMDYSKKELGAKTEQYLVCENCGLVYMYPRPKAETLKEYYELAPVSRTSSKVMSKYKGLEYRYTMDFIMEHTPFPGFKKIVEVGAGAGDLLHLFDHYTAAKLIGIEISKKSCDYARNNYGVEMIQEQFEEVDLTERDLNESVDLVICCNSLEHIIEPFSFLQKLGRMVRSKGFLYIEVPSTKGFATSKRAKCGRNIHHLHLNHFLAHNLIFACEKMHFSYVISIDDDKNGFPSLRMLFIKQEPYKLAKEFFLKQVNIIEETYKEAEKVILETFKRLPNNKKVVFWGAGEDLFFILRNNKVLSFDYSDKMLLVDKNPNKQGKKLAGLKIINPNNIIWDDVGYILITPSNDMLKIDIKNDVNEIFPHVGYSFLFPVSEEKGD